jgi:methionine sulfoxide reductase catalytic subunit
MLIRKPGNIPSSEITPPAVWAKRRDLLKAALAVAASRAGIVSALSLAVPARPVLAGDEKIRGIRPSPLSTREPPSSRDDITRYTNFYELGYSSEEPKANAALLKTRPWTVAVDGVCEAPGEIGIEDILSRFTQEERIYRLRCVEAWSMVIPWVGFPLGDLLKRFKPTSEARFVAFESILDPEHLPGQQHAMLPCPYREGLRLDEAMHPLTILATGLYDEVLPNQNGAPLRLVLPWKYGFKSIKSIVRITFAAAQPKTAWNSSQPREYGFYGNVNPQVDHPRWSQATERRLGELRRHRTLPFNGYADQVAAMYAGLDLKKFF